MHTVRRWIFVTLFILKFWQLLDKNLQNRTSVFHFWKAKQQNSESWKIFQKVSELSDKLMNSSLNNPNIHPPTSKPTPSHQDPNPPTNTQTHSPRPKPTLYNPKPNIHPTINTHPQCTPNLTLLTSPKGNLHRLFASLKNFLEDFSRLWILLLSFSKVKNWCSIL